ncbi:MAG TPA: PaaI family thioesterase [Burkholderiales bacterium]|jgi:acyl-coenzyme A thioesterase PaaI-like protein|nr:PaaI family thioesterase [Burkholderiales bacterium]
MTAATTLRARTAIRRRTLAAIAANRTPGLHFVGHFLDFEWRTADKLHATVAMRTAAHCAAPDGTTHLIPLSVLADTALATATRLQLRPGARQATIQMHLQFTGVAPRGNLVADARFHQFTRGSTRQLLSTATIGSNGRPVCHASGAFMALPAPAGVRLAPLPWQRGATAHTEPLDEQQLTPAEKRILRRCDTALEQASQSGSFIGHFWDDERRGADSRAGRRIAVGHHITNRVGHVQGGILFGLAATGSISAAPRQMALSNISAWFIRAGQGSHLTVKSRLLHAGRTTAVVQTTVSDGEGRRVLEAMSSHVARS